MTSKAPAAFLDDDFCDLLNSSSMDVEDDSLEAINSLIISLKDDATLEDKLKQIQALSSFIDTVPLVELDKIILQHLMPSMKQFLSEVFTEIAAILSIQENELDTLSRLQEHLHHSVSVYKILDSTLEQILRNQVVSLTSIQSLPLATVDMLVLTFEHCKISNQTYRNYFDDVTEIVQLFKKAQDVHCKLLKLFSTCLQFNFRLPEHADILNKLLDVLGKIGEVLVDLNLKALADNWKSYMAVSQKYIKQLRGNCYDASKAIDFIQAEILRNLGNLKPVQDAKTLTQSLKISNFFVKVLTKLYELYWPKRCKLVEFFISVQMVHPVRVSQRKFDEGAIRAFDELIFSALDPLLGKALSCNEFCQDLSDCSPNDFKLLLLLTRIFKKNHVSDPDVIVVLVEKLFVVVNENFVGMFSDEDFFDSVLKNVTGVVLSLPPSAYSRIELILLSNMLKPNHIWGSLLATEIWSLILSSQKDGLLEETVVKLTGLFGPVLQTTPLFYNPQVVLLQNFLNRTASLMSEASKLNLIETYPPSSNLHLWKCFGLSCLPASHSYLIESLVIDVIEKCEELQAGKCDLSCFNYLCHAFELISSLPTPANFDLQHLAATVSKFWCFEYTGADNFLFNGFLRQLTCATVALCAQFTNEQLLLVLTKLKQVHGGFKFQTLQVLEALSSRAFKQPQLPQIIQTISQLFRSLLLDEDVIVKHESLEVFVDFVSTTQYDEIATNVIGSDSELEKLVEWFVTEKRDRRDITEEFYKSLKKSKFVHVCPKVPDCTVQSLGAEVIAKRIKSDVGLYLKEYGRSDAHERCTEEVMRVLFNYVNK